MKKLTVLIFAVLLISCSDDVIDPVTTDVVVEKELVEEEQESNEEDDSLQAEKVFTNSIAVSFGHTKDDGANDFLLKKYKQGSQVINESEPINMTTNFDIESYNRYRIVQDDIYFWKSIWGNNQFLSYSLQNNSIEIIDNHIFLTEDELTTGAHQLCGFPSLNYFISYHTIITSHNQYQSFINFFNRELNSSHEIMLLDESGRDCFEDQNKIYGDFYIFKNEKNEITGVDGYKWWNVLDLKNNQLISSFQTPIRINDGNFSVYNNAILFADGSVFDFINRVPINGYDFPFEMGLPDMTEAIFKNDLMVTISQGVVNDNFISSKGVVLYDFKSQKYKSVSIDELRAGLLKLTDNQKVINDIYDAVYDFENEVIALSFQTQRPEFGVMFVDFDANILEYHVYENDSAPRDLFEIK